MDHSKKRINKLCEEILSDFEKFQRLDSLHRRITFALQQPDSLREKGAWKQLKAYRTGTDEKDIQLESADSLEEQHSQRLQRQDELAGVEDQVAEERDLARVELIALIEDLVNVLSEEDDTKKEKIISLKRAVKSDLRGDIIADALDCSSGYPGKFRWQDG